MNTRLKSIVALDNAKIEAAYDIKDAVNTINLTSLAVLSTKDKGYAARSGGVVNANRQKYKAAVEKVDRLEATADGKALIGKIHEGGRRAGGYRQGP